MASHTTEQIRNIAIVGHASAGKTTLTEALLAQAGVIKQAGSVEKGNTVADFEPEEKNHQHSLGSSITHLKHKDAVVHVIDTPGYPDFVGHALSALPAIETAVVVVNAQAGPEMITTRMMTRAAERNLGRMIVINKIDADNIDLPGVLEALREAYGKVCLPLNLPAGGGSAVADCFFKPGGNADFSSVDEARTQLVEQIVEVDEALMEEYLDKGEVSFDKLQTAFKAALKEGHLVPVCFASARTGAGVPELLDVFQALLPSPLQATPPLFVNGENEEPVTVELVEDQPVLAHVFKVSVDPFVGKLGVFRVHRGKVTKDTQLYIGDARKPFRIGHLFQLQGKDTEEIDAAVPGDLCAVAKVDDISFDAILHEAQDETDLKIKPVPLPTPMVGLAIEPKRRGEEQKVSAGLHKLLAEDPCFVVEQNAALNETVIRGLGELHLRVILEKMRDRHNAEVETRPPKIPYKETIGAKAEGHHRHKKQTGGAGQFGEVYLRVEPTQRGEGFEFVNAIVGGVIPGQFIPSVEKGVRQVLETGAVAGYPMQDIRVTLYDGKHHPVDSKEVAFIAAGKKAFVEAVNKARPMVLEPIVNIQITCPENNMGDIAGDLSSKRGRVSNTQTLPGGMIQVSGQVPLSEVTNYQSKLKSVTGGQGSYNIEFSHYDPVPPNIQQDLVAQFKPSKEED